MDEGRKLTEEVTCSGQENRVEKCRIDYAAATGGRAQQKKCLLRENVVSVTCIHDSFAVCPAGEVPWKVRLHPKEKNNECAFCSIREWAFPFSVK